GPRRPALADCPPGARLQGAARTPRRRDEPVRRCRRRSAADQELRPPPAGVVPPRPPDHLAGHGRRTFRRSAHTAGKLVAVSIRLEKYQAVGNDFLILLDADGTR